MQQARAGWSGNACSNQRNLPARALGERLHAHKEHISSDVESGTIIAPAAIARGLVGENRPEMFTGRRNHEHATGSSRPDVALLVHLQTVAGALAVLSAEWLRIEEHPALADGSVLLHVVGHQARRLPVADRNIEHFFIRRKTNAVGKRQILRE